MKRDRNDVLRSITLLLGEVNRVSRLAKTPVNHDLSLQYEGHSEYVSKQQVSAITDALLRSASLAGHVRDRKTLEAMVERTLTSAIRTWMDKSLKGIVDEVVEQEVARTQMRRVG
jgi:cell pole-organizing protein PopZ